MLRVVSCTPVGVGSSERSSIRSAYLIRTRGSPNRHGSLVATFVRVPLGAVQTAIDPAVGHVDRGREYGPRFRQNGITGERSARVVAVGKSGVRDNTGRFLAIRRNRRQ